MQQVQVKSFKCRVVVVVLVMMGVSVRVGWRRRRKLKRRWVLEGTLSRATVLVSSPFESRSSSGVQAMALSWDGQRNKENNAPGKSPA